MKTLVVGSGGREHAIVRALKLSPSVSEIHAFPGSHGMMNDALCHQWDGSPSSLIDYAKKTQIDLIIIGPEQPLADGLAETIRSAGLKAVGPGKVGAQLEASKLFAKEFMVEAGVPTSAYQEVKTFDELMRMSTKFAPPYIFKADGLAAGKGVFVCKDLSELKDAGEKVFVKKELGAAANRTFLEEFKEGWELSYLIITNGRTYQSLPLSQDHKRLQDNDIGPNTGGMGTVAPLKIDAQLNEQIQNKVLKPIMDLMSKKNWDYRGILYVGMMITKQGPSVLEFNVRFGDPEAQVILPLLDGDWGDVFLALSQGEVVPLKWRPLHAACVVLAAEGYPDHPRKGVNIEGDAFYETSSSYFLHAGTKNEKGQWQTNGGRVMNAIGLGSSLKEALTHAYNQSTHVKWPKMQIRKDIGKKVL